MTLPIMGKPQGMIIYPWTMDNVAPQERGRDPDGTKNQRYGRKIRHGTWIINQCVECALLG